MSDVRHFRTRNLNLVSIETLGVFIKYTIKKLFSNFIIPGPDDRNITISSMQNNSPSLAVSAGDALHGPIECSEGKND